MVEFAFNVFTPSVLSSLRIQERGAIYCPQIGSERPYNSTFSSTAILRAELFFSSRSHWSDPVHIIFVCFISCLLKITVQIFYEKLCVHTKNLDLSFKNYSCKITCHSDSVLLHTAISCGFGHFPWFFPLSLPVSVSSLGKTQCQPPSVIGLPVFLWK